MDRDSFITYKTWVEGIEEMPEELQAKAYKLIAHYALYGEKPDKNTPWELRSFFYGNVKKFIDDNIQKYEELTERRREAGRKGMAKRWSKKGVQNTDNKKVNNKNNNVISVINKNNKNNNVISVNNKNNLYDDDDVYVDDNDNDNNNKLIVINNNTSIKDLTKQKKAFDFIEFFNWEIKNAKAQIPQIKSLTGEREKFLNARIREYGLEAVKEVVQKAAASDFLNGGGQKGWVADCTWLLRPNNFPKILEGNYDNNNNKQLIISNHGAGTTTKNGADKHATIAHQNDIFDEYIRKADEEWHERQRQENDGRVTTVIPEQID